MVPEVVQPTEFQTIDHNVLHQILGQIDTHESTITESETDILRKSKYLARFYKGKNQKKVDI